MKEFCSLTTGSKSLIVKLMAPCHLSDTEMRETIQSSHTPFLFLYYANHKDYENSQTWHLHDFS